MNEVIETLHEVSNITNADMFSVLVMGMMIGCFFSNGFHALIQFIVKKVKENKNDKAGY